MSGHIACSNKQTRVCIFPLTVIGKWFGSCGSGCSCHCDALIFHATGEVVAGFALRTLRVRVVCARFRRGTASNLGANWGKQTRPLKAIIEVGVGVSIENDVCTKYDSSEHIIHHPEDRIIDIVNMPFYPS